MAGQSQNSRAFLEEQFNNLLEFREKLGEAVDILDIRNVDFLRIDTPTYSPYVETDLDIVRRVIDIQVEGPVHDGLARVATAIEKLQLTLSFIETMNELDATPGPFSPENYQMNAELAVSDFQRIHLAYKNLMDSEAMQLAIPRDDREQLSANMVNLTELYIEAAQGSSHDMRLLTFKQLFQQAAYIVHDYLAVTGDMVNQRLVSLRQQYYTHADLAKGMDDGRQITKESVEKNLNRLRAQADNVLSFCDEQIAYSRGMIGIWAQLKALNFLDRNASAPISGDVRFPLMRLNPDV